MGAMVTLEDLLKRAASFVDKQKGRWDDAAWRALVADKGLGLSGDAERYFGALLESLKRLYQTATHHDLGRGVGDVLQSVSAQAARFVQQSQGAWEHSGWEQFLKDVQQKGVRLIAEATPAVGDLLEAAKRIYHTLACAGADAVKGGGNGKQAAASAPPAPAASAAEPSKSAAPARAAAAPLKKVASKPAAAAASGNGSKAPAPAAKPLKAGATKERKAEKPATNGGSRAGGRGAKK